MKDEKKRRGGVEDRWGETARERENGRMRKPIVVWDLLSLEFSLSQYNSAPSVWVQMLLFLVVACANVKQCSSLTTIKYKKSHESPVDAHRKTAGQYAVSVPSYLLQIHILDNLFNGFAGY